MTTSLRNTSRRSMSRSLVNHSDHNYWSPETYTKGVPSPRRDRCLKYVLNHKGFRGPNREPKEWNTTEEDSQTDGVLKLIMRSNLSEGSNQTETSYSRLRVQFIGRMWRWQRWWVHVFTVTVVFDTKGDLKVFTVEISFSGETVILLGTLFIRIYKVTINVFLF